MAKRTKTSKRMRQRIRRLNTKIEIITEELKQCQMKSDQLLKSLPLQ